MAGSNTQKILVVTIIALILGGGVLLQKYISLSNTQKELASKNTELQSKLDKLSNQPVQFVSIDLNDDNKNELIVMDKTDRPSCDTTQAGCPFAIYVHDTSISGFNSSSVFPTVLDSVTNGYNDLRFDRVDKYSIWKFTGTEYKLDEVTDI